MARIIKGQHNFKGFAKTSGKKVLSYFFIFLFLYLGISFTILFDVNSTKSLLQSSMNTEIEALNVQADLMPVLRESALAFTRIHYKLTILVFIAGFGSTGFFYFFIKRILIPLESMKTSLEEISRGDLGKTVSAKGIDEVRHIGGLVNDITSNLQEILLLATSIGSSSQKVLEQMTTEIENETQNNKCADLEEQISNLYENMEELKEVINFFQFYKVKIEDGQIQNNEHYHENNELN